MNVFRPISTTKNIRAYDEVSIINNILNRIEPKNFHQ